MHFVVLPLTVQACSMGTMRVTVTTVNVRIRHSVSVGELKQTGNLSSRIPTENICSDSD